MSGITRVSIDVLKIHPRNQEFFDDISGEDYIQFKDSIAEDGIISEIIVSPDMVILSGHQRYKAACELGFDTVPIRIREDIESEEQKLKLLLAANFGRKSNSKSKQRKIADEYVRLCGHKHGGDRKENSQDYLTLSEIADQLGTTETSLKRSLRIERNIIDEIKDLMDLKVLPSTFVADKLYKLSIEQQHEFLKYLSYDKKYTVSNLNKIYNVVSGNIDSITKVITSDYITNKRKDMSDDDIKKFINKKGKCDICGYDFVPVLQIHHIVPLSKFGTNDEENLSCLCPTCHKILHYLYRIDDMNKVFDSLDLLKNKYEEDFYLKMSSIYLKYVNALHVENSELYKNRILNIKQYCGITV